MCLLVCIRGVDGSLAIAANRDESYSRPAALPLIWPGAERILAGRDELAGGTWLAVSAAGVVAAVTNRPTVGGDAPSRPTRGGLPLLACRCSSARRARSALGDHLAATRYNGFNLLVADAEEAFVVQCPDPKAGADRPGRFQQVPPGLHVVGNGAWDDRRDERVRRALAILDPAAAGQAGPAAVEALMAVCRDHQVLPDGQALCLHGPAGGTVSSTILTVRPDRRLATYLYAPGPPCTHPYRDLSAMMRTDR